MHTPNTWALALALPLIFSHVASAGAAGFFDDSKVSLTARNYYLDRDFKGQTPWPAAREWAQGFILKAQSGFSEGTVGFGLDATALLGLKLDSSPDRTGTQLLAYNPSTREARDEYSELGLTFKARVAHSLLRVGTLMPGLPVLTASPARLLPQWFRGAYATSQDIKGLTLHGCCWRVQP